jgi:UPF0288 family protein (methanogenesis marker protein 3)
LCKQLIEGCKLVDVSEKGARLTVSDVYDLPDRIMSLEITRQC